MAARNLITKMRRHASKYLYSIYELVDLQRELVVFLEHESWHRAIRQAPYNDPKRLLGYGYKAFSESDEDGLIAEIFRRIGVESRTFFEFGVGDGLANNTLNLLLGGWSGYWIDGSATFVKLIEERHARFIASGQLRVLNGFITVKSINNQIAQLGIPKSIDLLSIDIDGNDYWIWEAIEAVSPRVVVIEYNATLRPPHRLVMEYKDDNWRNGTNYFGASLCALEALGRKKGYSLVCCNYTGVNAFFVRNDLVEDRFFEPFTAEAHYEPGRYLKLKAGHPVGIGPYREV